MDNVNPFPKTRPVPGSGPGTGSEPCCSCVQELLPDHLQTTNSSAGWSWSSFSTGTRVGGLATAPLLF